MIYIIRHICLLIGLVNYYNINLTGGDKMIDKFCFIARKAVMFLIQLLSTTVMDSPHMQIDDGYHTEKNFNSEIFC